MTDSPVMAPIPLRPANAQAAPDAGKILPMDADDSTTADDVFARDQMREQQEERASRLITKNRRKRYLDLHPEYFDDSSLELADLILDEAEVAVVPGEAFGPSGYLRLSYALGDDQLLEGVARLQSLFA